VMEAVQHIMRSPLPWRPDEELTECGKPAVDFAKVISRDLAVAQHRDLGATRFAMVTCITCTQTANRWPTFDMNPVDRLLREAQRPSPLFKAELRALAMLAAAHPEEFTEAVADLGNTVDLAAARRASQRGRL
jgi:hypothetical protein